MLQFKEDNNQRQHELMFRRIIIFSSSPSGKFDVKAIPFGKVQKM